MILAASSDKEKDLWLNDLSDSINQCTQLSLVPTSLVIDSSASSNTKSGALSPSKASDPNNSEAAASETQESEEEGGPSGAGPDKVSYHRSNTTMHVCWHRQTSVSMNDHIKSVQVCSLLCCSRAFNVVGLLSYNKTFFFFW